MFNVFNEAILGSNLGGQQTAATHKGQKVDKERRFYIVMGGTRGGSSKSSEPSGSATGTGWFLSLRGTRKFSGKKTNMEQTTFGDRCYWDGN